MENTNTSGEPITHHSGSSEVVQKRDKEVHENYLNGSDKVVHEPKLHGNPDVHNNLLHEEGHSVHEMLHDDKAFDSSYPNERVDMNLTDKIISKCHNSVVGHFGVSKTKMIFEESGQKNELKKVFKGNISKN
jgi:hypothetical protein